MHYLYTNLEKKNRRISRFLLISFALLLIFSVFLPVLSGNRLVASSDGKMQTEKKLFNIVILGDSLAAGYEYGFTEQSKPYGAGEHLYEQALFQGNRAAYTNYGVLGLRSEGLKLWLEAAKQQKTVVPHQIQAGLKDPRVDKLLGDTTKLYEDLTNADLIMLAIGGNDFLQIITQLDLTKAWSSWSDAERTALKDQIQQTTKHYELQLDAILSLLHELNPDATFVTQNQYLPLPKLSINGTEAYVGVDSHLANLLIEGRKGINDTFSKVISAYSAKGMNLDYINTVESIESNALGLTAIGSMDVHPNAAGYKKLAEQYSKLIWGEFREVQPRKANIPLSVVVNGKEVISQYPTKLINGRTYLVLRDITDAMGAELKWNNKSQTATIQLSDRTVELTINAKTYKVNGQTYPLNAEPAFIEKVNKETKTYVPVAALSEGLNLFVDYRAQSKTVFVNP